MASALSQGLHAGLGSGAHTSGLTQAFLSKHPELKQEYFPPYAPDLNPQDVMETSKRISKMLPQAAMPRLGTFLIMVSLGCVAVPTSLKASFVLPVFM